MAFDWNNFLVFAKKIKKQADEGLPEGDWALGLKRSAISRAYYATYHLSENYAVGNMYKIICEVLGNRV